MLVPQILSHVSLEPVMFLYFCALTLTGLSSQNLLLQKVCLGGTEAPPIGVRECQDELTAQKEVTFIQTWKELIVLVGPVLFVMFAGPWSDSHGRRRKPLMYLPLIGQMLADFLCILNVYFWSWSPSVAALSGSIIPAVTGWRSCFAIGVITLVCDNTNESSRMMKVGICYTMYFLATPCGAFIFGLIFNKIGFYGTYFLCIAMDMTAVMYLFMLIPENLASKNEVKLKAWEGLFDPKQVIQCFETVFKPRDGYRRAIVLLCIVVAPLTLAPFLGKLHTKLIKKTKCK